MDERRLAMKKSKFGEQKIVNLLREIELGAKMGEGCRKFDVLEATFDRWQVAWDGTEASYLKQ